MKNIVVFCSAGMSSSALILDMRKVAERNSLDYAINAYAMSLADEKGKDADVILLGPQIRYKKNDIQRMFPDIPVDIIDMTDYGMLNGKNVIKQARKLMKKKEQ